MKHSHVPAEHEWSPLMANHVFGVFDDPATARAARDELTAGGFFEDDVHNCCGPEVAQREIDPDGKGRGLLGRIRRALEGMVSDEIHQIREFADESARATPALACSTRAPSSATPPTRS